MSAVKALAWSAVVLVAATQATWASGIGSGQITWTSWATPNGVFQVPVEPAVTTASLFGASTPPASVPSPSTAYAAPAPTTYAAPVATPSTAAVPSARYDAFINLGSGPYPNADHLTSGGAQPWYDSAGVARLFGGTPNAQQQAGFTAAVVQQVERGFALSGVPVTVTTDPNAPAAHTLSVVSHTNSSWGPGVLGLTNIGSNGFDFVGVAARAAQNVAQLESIVAHNVDHELMLAFGVPENYDHTGHFIDSPTANLSMMLDPNATFSQGASLALLGQNFQNNNDPASPGAQIIGPMPVPEPTTIAAWAAVLGGLALARSRRARASA